ncbi:uncharacterized protein LOC133526703 isoform X2 [Cydia pomonella]|uniref:uncharacterized protein LOC133526703 isoform X2 n=1 Tax=Cydia pomonella TaxID=82600 RepID=UPI002ADD9136|nr:uncharacterized protein LOC133526703 isoform X2 [Cydia pomonella]
MFILITFFVSHNIFVNAKYYEVVREEPGSTYSPTNDLGRTKAIEVFPNHAIEIHVEKTQDEPPQIPYQYMNWLRANPNFQTKARRPIERSGENLEMSTTSSPTSTTTTTTTTSTSTFPTRTSDLLTSPPTDNTISKDNRKRPLYIEDLIQALEDFHKKTKQDKFTASNRIDLATDDDPDRPLVKKDLWDLENIISSRGKFIFSGYS